jgi:hypothetical protein
VVVGEFRKTRQWFLIVYDSVRIYGVLLKEKAHFTWNEPLNKISSQFIPSSSLSNLTQIEQSELLGVVKCFSSLNVKPISCRCLTIIISNKEEKARSHVRSSAENAFDLKLSTVLIVIIILYHIPSFSAIELLNFIFRSSIY